MSVKKNIVDPPEISIIIPAFNEQRRLFNSVNAVLDYCRKNFRSKEIILVNDGSDDDTLDIMKRLRRDNSEIIIVNNAGKMGKGYSIKEGMKRSTGNYICFTDADLSAPIWQVEKLIQCVSDGYDIAIGSRALPDSDITIHQPWFREHMGKMFNSLIRIFLGGLDIKDTQCGFKLFKKDAVIKILSKSTIDGFSFDVELLYIAYKMGLKIREVPIIWEHSSHSKVRLFEDSAKMLSDLIQIRSNNKRGKYE